MNGTSSSATTPGTTAARAQPTQVRFTLRSPASFWARGLAAMAVRNMALVMQFTW